ncbi:hypothetical protein H3H36_17620 [Duganella sp. FT3S]|uniref:Uncharacterized protein n=1 Tax=Rugamonas fusca TaxID=2758568 RepID=A0A7W2EJR7_9BURK|nr:hypothetical protein [Rugamonas fusca]MBA5607178.1 hypothetical protein [Rugamonas fusca]
MFPIASDFHEYRRQKLARENIFRIKNNNFIAHMLFEKKNNFYFDKLACRTGEFDIFAYSRKHKKLFRGIS